MNDKALALADRYRGAVNSYKSEARGQKRDLLSARSGQRLGSLGVIAGMTGGYTGAAHAMQKGLKSRSGKIGAALSVAGGLGAVAGAVGINRSMKKYTGAVRANKKSKYLLKDRVNNIAMNRGDVSRGDSSTALRMAMYKSNADYANKMRQ